MSLQFVRSENRSRHFSQLPPGVIPISISIHLLRGFSLQQIKGLRFSLGYCSEREIEDAFYQNQSKTYDQPAAGLTDLHTAYQGPNTQTTDTFPTWTSSSPYTDMHYSNASGPDFYVPTSTSRVSNLGQPPPNAVDPSPMMPFAEPYVDQEFAAGGSRYQAQPTAGSQEEFHDVDGTSTTEAGFPGLHSPASVYGANDSLTSVLTPSTAQGESSAVATRPKGKKGGSKAKDKLIPCPDYDCDTMLPDKNCLLQHCSRMHDRDVRYTCGHGCVTVIPYQDPKAATRHHNQKHRDCQNSECIEQRIMRSRKFWACNVCLFVAFGDALDWAVHYCAHFTNKNEVTASGMCHPKDRLSLKFELLNLVKQPEIEAPWEERNQILNYPNYEWNHNRHALESIFIGLRYGIYKGRSVEKQEIARELVLELSTLAKVTSYPTSDLKFSSHKRPASTSPTASHFDKQTISMPLLANPPAGLRKKPAFSARDMAKFNITNDHVNEAD